MDARVRGDLDEQFRPRAPHVVLNPAGTCTRFRCLRRSVFLLYQRMVDRLRGARKSRTGCLAVRVISITAGGMVELAGLENR